MILSVLGSKPLGWPTIITTGCLTGRAIDTSVELSSLVLWVQSRWTCNCWAIKTFPRVALNRLRTPRSCISSRTLWFPDVGEIFTEQFLLVSNVCIDKVNNLPPNANEIELFDEVFVISQPWGNNIFHEMIENIPRLAIHLEFLKRHPRIPILSYGKRDGRIGEIFRVLGLDETRIYNGWCRGKIVYLPRPSPCGSGNVQELQMLAWHFRNFMERNFEPERRNRIVLIRRSLKRKFTKQEEIERVVRSAALQNNLTFTLFRDDPTPLLNLTMMLFKSALMVVGPHGAGLSNIIFSDPGTIVIEGVCNLPHLNMCYHRLAQVLGHRWHGVPSRGGCEGVVDVDPAALDIVIRNYLAQFRFQQSQSSRHNWSINPPESADLDHPHSYFNLLTHPWFLF